MIRLKESECLYEEKLEILKRGRCNSIFPLSIVHFGSNITGYYKISGYRKLGDYRELTEDEVRKLMIAAGLERKKK